MDVETNEYRENRLAAMAELEKLDNWDNHRFSTIFTLDEAMNSFLSISFDFYEVSLVH